MTKTTIAQQAKPFIKWVGGKTQLLHEIEKQLPKDFAQRKMTYIEPFVGGGAVLFWILQKYPNITKAVINDINSDLTDTYQIVKNKPNELINELQKIQDEYLPLEDSTRKAYYLQKRDLFNSKTQDKVQKSALFIFLNRTCFNGLYRVNSKGLFNVPFGKYANPKICDSETILADSELLHKVEIKCGDFSETLQYADENSFFYFDPPYKPLSETSSFNSYVKEIFDDAEQIRLGDFCKKLNSKKSSFILSNSDVKGKNPQDNFFDDLYNVFNIQRVFATRMVNANPEKRGKLTELMITNFINNETYLHTAEDLFNMHEYQKIFIDAIGDVKFDDFARNKYRDDIAKTKNYKQGIFYHATGGFGEIGLGRGLYLGKDKKALNNFYNCEGECGYIQVFKGNPKFLDLTYPNSFEDFEQKAIEQYGKDSSKEYLKKMTINLEYDGIRYFDPIATGEEFILYNINKVERTNHQKKQKNVES